MTDQELQRWVEQISLDCFQLPFRHRASFNRRLRATGGRYFTGSHNIEISWLQWEKHGASEVEKIIKHELCHYHLHLANRGYRHRDADFKYWLARVGGSRYCKPVADGKRKVQPYRYMLTCRACGMQYKRKRKVDITRYVCGKCKGKLQLEYLDSP